MPSTTPSAHHPAQTWLQRGVARAIAAVTTVLEVFAEAEDRSSAARDRFPLAD